MAKKNSDFFRAPSNTIVDALKASNERVKQLEQEVAKLKKELSKYKTQSAQQRQRAKSLQGQLSAARAKVVSLQKGLKIQKRRVKQAEAKQVEAERETQKVKDLIREIKPKMTRDQLFEFYRSSNLERFWERVEQVHPNIDPQKLLEMKARMAQWSSQRLRDVVRMAGWRSTWYDSDAAWNSSELTGWDERNLYAFIMSYES